MDDVQNRLARELADAMAAAVAESAEVERCRQRARAEGYLLKVSLEATVGFSPLEPGDAPADEAETVLPPFEVSPDDRRFLRSLRIAADEAQVEEAN
ncbi:MAG: hypothetical protein R2708_21365 [Vicinamibacterales bacterium]